MHPIRSLLLPLCLAVAAAPASAQAPALVPLTSQPPAPLAWPCETYRIRSEALREDFRVFVAKPPSFETAHRTYPVLLVLDGQYYVPEVASVVASLVANGQIPELVLVGIESRDRRRDFTPAGIRLPDVGDRARADATLDFLEEELLPALEPLRCGTPRVLLGHSHAAILVLHALAMRPETFPWGISLDAPTRLEHDFLARNLAETLARAERPDVRMVSCEARFDWPEKTWAQIAAHARPGDLLRTNPMPEEAHESMVFAASYKALQQLFADASTVEARELSALEVEQRFRALAAVYGDGFPPPEPLMRRVLEDLLMEGYGARAGTWMQRYEEVYGRAEDHDELLRRVAQVTALGEPEETVAELLARPFPSPAALSKHLGTWTGALWSERGPRDPVTLRLWVEDGGVRGELEHQDGPTQALEFLNLRPDGGLEFGFMNGMRPRGLLVYSEKTPGGPLEGEMGFRGIRFVPPPGHTPNPLYFELTRQP